MPQGGEQKCHVHSNDKNMPTGSSCESVHTQQQSDHSKASVEKQWTNTPDSLRFLSVPQPMEHSLICREETTLDSEMMNIDQSNDTTANYQGFGNDNVVTTGRGIGATNDQSDMSMNYDCDSPDEVCSLV